ncbi:MAG: peptidylprolyl isomerase [Bacteroidia bacterium]|nr:peptidylprolyl isomerase [Bacteroidia bacterium]MDW8345998.1 peptidylprolyl isomerase [Bacteroidia bacterium]
MRIRLSLFILFFNFLWAYTQENVSESKGIVLDEIIAVVGDNIVLRSDLEREYNELIMSGEQDDGTLKCEIFSGLLASKLLLSRARIDSITVPDDRVERELNKRISMFIERLGSKEKLEELYGKPLSQFKIDMRSQIKELLIVQTMQNKVTGDVKITPKEVKDFFEKIPKDSLPVYEEELEIRQIVIFPTMSKNQIETAYKVAKNLREAIVRGELDFEKVARDTSDDTGSAVNGGDIGWTKRGELVPEYEAVAFTLPIGKVSEPVESMYGWHIIQTLEQKGEQVHTRHILIKPKTTSTDDGQAVLRLDSIRKLIINKKISPLKAVKEFSEDKQTVETGGFLTNPQTGRNRIPAKLLESEVYFKIQDLKEGEVTEPFSYTHYDGKKGYRILILEKRIPSHIANLNDDYERIQNAALSEKRNQVYQEWVKENSKKVYVEIRDKSFNCKELEIWKR